MQATLADPGRLNHSVTTFSTTPLTLLFYPKAYRLQNERERREKEAPRAKIDHSSDTRHERGRFSIVLQQFDQLPAVFAFCGLLGGTASKVVEIEEKSRSPPGFIHSVAALRLVELTDRTSALIKASQETEQTLLRADTLVSVFRSFARTLGLSVTSSLTITAKDNYDEMVKSHAEREQIDCVVIPWMIGSAEQDSTAPGPLEPTASSYLPPNPFASLFGVHGPATREGSPQYASFVRQVFAEGEPQGLIDWNCPRGADYVIKPPPMSPSLSNVVNSRVARRMRVVNVSLGVGPHSELFTNRLPFRTHIPGIPRRRR